MTERTPIETVWDGRAFSPTNDYWVRRANKEYVVGECYRIADVPERSKKSHDHYFISIENAFNSLPPLHADRFRSPEALRKWALIEAGYCTSIVVPCGTHRLAQEMAVTARAMDGYCVATVQGSVLTIFRAESQSYRSMKKERFQKSKDDSLRVIAEMLEVSKSELHSAGEAA